MAKESTVSERMLDVWAPPADAGEPIGFLATTFTFNGSFFEEDCLSAFLQLESDPDSEALSYILEREEKLNKLECAMVLADQHHCRSNRNIRWDLLPVRMPRGIQHAKISLLCWTNCMRLVVASANLTPEGYRRNQEIFSVFEARYQATTPTGMFTEMLAFLEIIIRNGVMADALVVDRGYKLINRVRQALKNWKMTEQNQDAGQIHVHAVLTGPGRPNALKQLSVLWQKYNTYLPDQLEVVSPFFDPAWHNENPHAKAESEFLGPKGEMHYLCPGEVSAEKKKGNRIFAPSFLKDRSKVKVGFSILPEMMEEGKEFRPVHMKAIRAYRGNWCLVMMGSGNFTSAGMGTGATSNYEANVAFVASYAKNEAPYKALTKCLPTGVSSASESLVFDPVPAEDGDQESAQVMLPSFLRSAEADMDGNKVMIRFSFDTTRTVDEFTIATEEGVVVLTSDDYKKQRSGDFVDVLWEDRSQGGSSPKSIPAGFEVSVNGDTRKSWLPLNVRNYNCLPPPEHLKELPLDVLLQVLTSARPLHQVLRRYFKELKSEDFDESEPDVMTDPHKRVDTSGFLLQRTRRISYAFNSIRERLTQPTGTLQSLNWKLYGPVGLKALVNALMNGSGESAVRIPEERLFLLAELILELSMINPPNAVNCLPRKVVKEHLGQFVVNVAGDLKKDPAYRTSWMKQYVNKTIARAMENLY